MIVYITTMAEAPKNCIDCTMSCALPINRRDHAKVLKPYLTKRHPKCPLRVVEEEHLKEAQPCR